MSKKENVVNFYLMATSLKDVIRSGWDDTHWNITKERRESVAEHVYGTCILAIGMYSEYQEDIDFNKVLKMLVLHELEEVFIGDITPYDNISAEEKLRRGHEAIKKVLSPLIEKDEYYDLLIEFDAHESRESLFAYQCDKLEADLMSKYYQDNGYQRSLDDQEGNVAFKSDKCQRIIENGAKTPYDIWHEADKELFTDEEFKEVFNYLQERELKRIIK